MSAKFSTVLGGVDQLNRAIKLADPRTKARVVGVIRKRTEAVASKARAAAPRVKGELASTIRGEYSKDGLIGYVKVGFGKLPRRSKAQTVMGQHRAKTRKRTVGRGAYAPVVERGDPRRHHLPHPFLMPGFEAEKPGTIKDIDHAINDSMKEV